MDNIGEEKKKNLQLSIFTYVQGNYETATNFNYVYQWTDMTLGLAS